MPSSVPGSHPSTAVRWSSCLPRLLWAVAVSVFAWWDDPEEDCQASRKMSFSVGLMVGQRLDDHRGKVSLSRHLMKGVYPQRDLPLSTLIPRLTAWACVSPAKFPSPFLQGAPPGGRATLRSLIQGGGQLGSTSRQESVQVNPPVQESSLFSVSLVRSVCTRDFFISFFELRSDPVFFILIKLFQLWLLAESF